MKIFCNLNLSGSKDHYSTLGVKSTATQREIKSAYYALSKKYHPDVAGSSTEQKFCDINEAYEILKDSERRRHYDNIRTGARGPRYTGDHGYQGDPFQEFYQRAAQQQQWQQTNYGNARSKRYSQQDYERIWEQFRRMSDERERTDANIHRERQRIWEELMRKRAQRWQEFHRKYPNGPPGQIKWEWNWRRTNNPKNNGSFELIRRIVIVYISVFTVVTIVQVILQSFGDSFTSKQYIQPQHSQERTDRERILAMMNENPAVRTRWEPNQMADEAAFQSLTTLQPSNSNRRPPSSPASQFSPHSEISSSDYAMGTGLYAKEVNPSFPAAVDEDGQYPYGMPTNARGLQ